MGLSLLFAWLFRRSLKRSAINRRVVGTVFFVFASEVAISLVAFELSSSLEAVGQLLMVVAAAASGTAAITIERRVWPVCLGYTVASGIIAFRPEAYPSAMSLGHVIFALSAAYMGWPRASGADARERNERTDSQ